MEKHFFYVPLTLRADGGERQIPIITGPDGAEPAEQSSVNQNLMFDKIWLRLRAKWDVMTPQREDEERQRQTDRQA